MYVCVCVCVCVCVFEYMIEGMCVMCREHLCCLLIGLYDCMRLHVYVCEYVCVCVCICVCVPVCV